MDDALTSIRSADRQRNWTQEWLNGHTYASTGPNEKLGDNDDDDQGFAARLYSLCLRLLRYLCRQEQNIASKRHRVSTLKEELGRLYLWGEAFGDGKLDRALGYSDDVRGNVLESLGDIGNLILRELRPSSISVLAPTSLQKSIQDLTYFVEQTKAITSTRNHAIAPDWTDESDTDKDSSSDDEDTTNIAEELRLHIQWLTQLGPVLEQNLVSAQKDRIQASLPEPVSFSVSGPAKIYVSLVREKYKQAQNQLLERLGEANWQRHISVRKSIEASVNVAEQTSAPIEELAVARSIFRPYSAFHDSGIDSSIPAQTEYASSHTSFQSSNTEGERESIRVPATPVEVNDGKPFQCFICKCLLSNIKNRVDWKMHIFADLKPYICTFADCEDELVQFPSRTAWTEHEFSKHRISRSWSCPECPQAFTSVREWQSHIQERHCLFLSGPNFNVAKDMAYKTEATRIENAECPLCRTVVGKPRRAFAKHVGRHMEEIALMALPRNVEEDSEAGSVSTDRTSLEGTGTSFHVKPSIETDAVRETEARPSGSITPFACDLCDQKFFKRHELNAHNEMHTRPFRCVVPECNFPGGRHQKDLDTHVQEKHGKAFAFDTNPASTAAPIKALPTVRFHTTDQLDAAGDEFIPREYDASGESKVSALGETFGGRVYNIRTFFVAHRGEKRFMLATECARVLGYRDSYLLFNKNRSLLKIIATQQEKEDLIHQEILPYSYRSRQIALVTAKSMFRQFGARIIEGGRRVRDDYWEAKAIEQGFTEEDMPGNKRPKIAKTMGTAGQAEPSKNGLAQNSPAFLLHVGSSGAGNPSTESNHALVDDQMQLMLLEQQNKKRLLMARQEQDNISGSGGAPTAPGFRVKGKENLASSASPESTFPSMPAKDYREKSVDDPPQHLLSNSITSFIRRNTAEEASASQQRRA